MTPAPATATASGELTPQQTAFRDSLIAARQRGAVRFASSREASRTPPALRTPYSRDAWLGLHLSEREAHLRTAVRERATREAVLLGAAPPVAEPMLASPAERARPEPERRPSSKVASPYVVTCAGLCGRWLPASGPRPVVRFCGGFATAAPAPRRHEDSLEAVVRALRAERDDDERAPRPMPPSGRKARRRPRCLGD